MLIVLITEFLLELELVRRVAFALSGGGLTHAVPQSYRRHTTAHQLPAPLSSSTVSSARPNINTITEASSTVLSLAGTYGLGMGCDQVTRVKSTGAALVQLNVLIKDMGLFGYSEDHVPPPALESLP